MSKFSGINITLLFPSLLVFIVLVLHCYFYRGRRLAFTFFGSVFLHTLMKELTHAFVKYKTALRPPYQVLGSTPQIFHLPLVVYVGWAITFYLSWYLAERVLKRIGIFFDRIFPTIVWSILMAGGISYCVEATATRAGWWLWMSPDFRFKDFLVAPFSTLEAWPSETAHFLLIFFLLECSRFRKQWWKVFLFAFALWMAIFGIFIYFITNFGRLTPVIRVYDSVRLLLPILLMFFFSENLQFTRIDSKSSKINEFFYNALPLFVLVCVLFTCVIMDLVILKEPELLISIFPLVLLIMFSIKRVPLLLIFILVAFFMVSGGQRLYILSIPTIVFLAFLTYVRLVQRIYGEK